MVAKSPRTGVGPGFDSQGSVILFHKYCIPNLYWIHWAIPWWSDSAIYSNIQVHDYIQMCSEILVSTRWSLWFQTKKCRLVSLGQVLSIQNGRPGLKAGGGGRMGLSQGLPAFWSWYNVARLVRRLSQVWTWGEHLSKQVNSSQLITSLKAGFWPSLNSQVSHQSVTQS